MGWKEQKCVHYRNIFISMEETFVLFIMPIRLTIVLSELKLDSEQVPSNFSWHFLCTAVWQAEKYQIKPLLIILIGGQFSKPIILTVTLISLFTESPQKFFTKGTECGLSKKFRYKLMSIYVMCPVLKPKHSFNLIVVLNSYKSSVSVFFFFLLFTFDI